MKKTIIVNNDNWDNIIKSELKKRKLENEGFYYIETKQLGLSKYKLIYGKFENEN